jgi:hypothetical protein
VAAVAQVVDQLVQIVGGVPGGGQHLPHVPQRRARRGGDRGQGRLLVLRRRGTRTFRRLVIAGLTSCYLAGVAAVTLPLQIRTGDYSDLIPWYEKGNLVRLAGLDTRPLVLNIVMTFPLGLLLAFLTRMSGAGQVALTGPALSAAVEVTQFLSGVLVSGGRTADVNDLPANTVGAVLGYLTHRWLTRLSAVADAAGRWGAAATRGGRQPARDSRTEPAWQPRSRPSTGRPGPPSGGASTR